MFSDFIWSFMSKPEAVKPATKSRLFLLPPELRNVIYEYVLTTPDATLKYTTNDTSGHKQLNQLQYVNKQLHQECAHLELKFNTTITISTRAEGKTTATEQFFALLASLPEEKHKWLRTVALQNTDADVNEYLTQRNNPGKRVLTQIDNQANMCRLAKLCRQMPYITVEHKWSMFSAKVLKTASNGPVEPLMVIALGVALSEHLLGDSRTELWPMEPNTRPVIEKGVEIVRGWNMFDIKGGMSQPLHESLRADNLHFFPMEDILESEEVPVRTGTHFNNKGEDLAPIWRAAIRKWVAEGL
ncbi:hypothetical protein J4E85_003781 [Alternaria conjuncta]|uniref:uncharacterized protein n=1 Tax=Alternaria conjuncta TaxID=181017 RepID=UPI0022205621|nr:uncharacterized protein J4E85_003781 [Alternaria conjuncta]KAI4931192.1 hypothetical protein J4E85_003781 [Alternaria conjuncta]